MRSHPSRSQRPWLVISVRYVHITRANYVARSALRKYAHNYDFTTSVLSAQWHGSHSCVYHTPDGHTSEILRLCKFIGFVQECCSNIRWNVNKLSKYVIAYVEFILDILSIISLRIAWGFCFPFAIDWRLESGFPGVPSLYFRNGC